MRIVVRGTGVGVGGPAAPLASAAVTPLLATALLRLADALLAAAFVLLCAAARAGPLEPPPPEPPCSHPVTAQPRATRTASFASRGSIMFPSIAEAERIRIT